MPENLFEKIDKQSEVIDSVAEKLDGISIEDLYALAKRTWDYKDYQTAQKYYNHISLLRPLDWKASFYASLCGCMGPELLNEWDRRPETVYRYFAATVDYILSRDISEQEKELTIKDIVEITLSVFMEYSRIYTKPENKDDFDKYAPKYKRNYQKSFIDIIRKIDEIPFVQSKIKEELCLECGVFIEKYCQTDKSISLTKDDFEKYILPYNDRIKYEEAIYEEPDPEKEKEIKLKGKCYLVYKDTVLEQRFKRINLVSAILLLLSTIATDVVPVLLGADRWLLFALTIMIPIDVALFVRGIGSRKGIRQDSLFYRSRWKYRKTSSGNVVCESHSTVGIIIGTLSSMGIGTANLLLICFGILSAIFIMPAIVQTICVYIFCYIDIRESDCIQKFEYQGKTYYFDK